MDSPGRNTASEDSAESLSLNPGNLGYLPAAELRWTGGEFCSGRAPKKVNCGHAFGDLATPLPFNLATGLRVDYVTPASGSGFPLRRVRLHAWGHVGRPGTSSRTPSPASG